MGLSLYLNSNMRSNMNESRKDKHFSLVLVLKNNGNIKIAIMHF
ncbi:hypothetical protein GGQ60_004357 [Pedobacter zeae]|uniref:Uncharacterized protein n=1 Tax=Pedobacter zeae TaxID=1737356 RepID=A0A7W6P728_9SPHI|nr:hypothetical protein [Pedobacter zeae]